MADWGQIIGYGSQALGNIMASQQAKEGIQNQNKLLEDAYQRALALLSSGELGYTPTQATGISRPVGDQGARLAQNDALSRLQEASREGFNVVDKAALNRTLNEANANERSQRESVLARMDPRSGAAQAAQMTAQQGAANRASQQAMDTAAQSRAKALAAMGQYGQLAGQMRNQEFGEQNKIDAFNSQMGQWNAGQINQARAALPGQKIAALGLAGGAGGALGQGLAALGRAQGQQTGLIGSTVKNGINAYSDATSNTGQGYDSNDMTLSGGRLRDDEDK